MRDATVELVILSSVHWHFTWQRHHEMASRLAERGYRVRYVEPIPKRWPGLGEIGRVWGRLTHQSERAGLLRQRLPARVEIVNPLFAPDVGPVTRWINRRLLGPRAAERLESGLGRPRLVLNYLPLPAAIELQRRLDPDLAIYDCVWDWPNDPYSRPGVLRESELVDASDLVFADSPFLFERMSGLHPRVERVLPAVDFELYEPARRSGGGGAGVRCVYFGAIGANIDLELVRRLSREFTLRLIGPVQSELGELGAGTEVLGAVAQAELPGLLADSDVIVLPYQAGGHGRGVIPAKTFECLATGKPVVATGLPSLEEFADCFMLVADPDAFVAAVRTAAGAADTGRRRRLEVARANSWEQRADSVDRLIRDALMAGGRAS